MRHTSIIIIVATGLIALTACQREQPATNSTATTTAAAPAPLDRAAFEQDVAKWRSERVERLRKPDGWLSLVGLHWVEPGVHQVGMADANDIQLRTGPAKLGTLTLKDGKAMFKPDPSASIIIGGKPSSGEIALQSDAKGDPTIVAFNDGSANFQFIERSGRFALRVKDANAPTRTGFLGIDYFVADPSWRVNARFEPHPAGQTIAIGTAINTIEQMANPGTVVFEKDGKSYRMEAVDEGDGRLFFMFSDRTSGKTTYGAGRTLYAAPPKNGMTVVDFNQSYNPPCVFTPFATCGLPPPENRLDLTITAGEKSYRGEAHRDVPEALPATVTQKGS